jgi:hypothetical protein
VLAIPLAIDLPCLNSRKTCALSIWLLQTQRLPEEVLVPAKDRIAYAIRRGIEGELGKEGKKGSASDGLRVTMHPTIHPTSINASPIGYSRPLYLPTHDLHTRIYRSSRICPEQPPGQQLEHPSSCLSRTWRICRWYDGDRTI